jgi:hypothetical protein
VVSWPEPEQCRLAAAVARGPVFKRAIIRVADLLSPSARFVAMATGDPSAELPLYQPHWTHRGNSARQMPNSPAVPQSVGSEVTCGQSAPRRMLTAAPSGRNAREFHTAWEIVCSSETLTGQTSWSKALVRHGADPGRWGMHKSADDITPVSPW